MMPLMPFKKKEMMPFKKNLACEKLLADFKSALKAAIRGYKRKFFLPYFPLPSYRVGDISVLEIFIDTFQPNAESPAQGKDFESNDKSPTQVVIDIIAKFKTGLIISEDCWWPSGKSTLKNALLEVTNKYSNEAFLKARNQDLERQLAFLGYKYKRLKDAIPSIAEMDGKEIHKLQTDFAKAKQNVQGLREENEELESTKKDLSKVCAKSKKHNVWFFDKTKQMDGENQALQQKLDRAHKSPNNARDDAQSGSAAATTSQSRYHGSLESRPRLNI